MIKFNNTNTILSEKQTEILNLISQEKNITDNFYLGEGTALAEFYLKHRLSEDLDFFSEEEVNVEGVSTFFKKISKQTGIQEVNIQQSFNRNLFLLKLEELEIKTEFTYYPFERIEKKIKVGELEIDSLLDIAVNKVFTIYQKPRSRDFIDLFCILQFDSKLTLENLIKMAQVKFGNYIEPLQFAAQCLKAESLKDYPTLLVDLKNNEWINYFVEISNKFASQELK